MKASYTLVGMKHRGTEEFVSSLRAGEPLTLTREPSNKFDKNAVQVIIQDKHVAYVKGSQAAGLARAMDEAGFKSVNGKLAFGGDRWPTAEVEE